MYLKIRVDNSGAAHSVVEFMAEENHVYTLLRAYMGFYECDPVVLSAEDEKARLFVFQPRGGACQSVVDDLVSIVQEIKTQDAEAFKNRPSNWDRR